MKATYSMTGEPTTGSEVNLKDTWLDVELGGSWSVRPNTYIYGTFTKNFGAIVEQFPIALTQGFVITFN